MYDYKIIGQTDRIFIVVGTYHDHLEFATNGKHKFNVHANTEVLGFMKKYTNY